MGEKTPSSEITGVLFESSSIIRGKPPVVPFRSGITLESLTEGDADPVFITLPIGEVGAESRNGRRYNAPIVQAIHDTILKEGTTGIAGHLKTEERAYKFDVPPLIWVGAVMEGQTLWGKAYVMQHATDVREYVKLAKRTHSAIGTSIYGTGRVDKDGTVQEIDLESIDLAHPKRVGVKAAAAVPVVTQESVEQTTHQHTQTETGDGEMPEKTTLPDNTNLKMNDRELVVRIRELEETIQKQRSIVADYTDLQEMFEHPRDLVSAVRASQAEKADLAKENQELLLDTVSAKVAEAVQMEIARPIVVNMVLAEKPSTRNAVENAIKTVMETAAVKALLKNTVVQESGPPQPAPNTTPQATDTQYFTIPTLEA